VSTVNGGQKRFVCFVCVRVCMSACASACVCIRERARMKRENIK
jgi:hypothetical protein